MTGESQGTRTSSFAGKLLPPPPSTPLRMTAAPSTAVFFTGTPTRVGPLLPNGEPLLLDPVANWELRRTAWLSRRQPQPRAAREPAFAARLEALQAMLRPPATTSPPPFGTTTSASGSTTGGKGKAVEEMRAEDEPDGGEVISSRERGDDELERAMESVLAAFRQGRPLKDPLPLSLVVRCLLLLLRHERGFALGGGQGN